MVNITVWEEILAEGKQKIERAKESKEREIEQELIKQNANPRYATIVTGVRRSGKSNVLLRVASKLNNTVYYINLEDERLTNAKLEDLTTLSKLLKLEGATIILDEIQNISGWEKWARRIIDSGVTKLYVSGSNSSLLSEEYSTLLTGRNRIITVFPFSYREYKKHTGKPLEIYLMEGGFPEPILSQDLALTKQYRTDILYKDIISRHKIREMREMEILFFHVLDNPGAFFSKKRLSPYVNLSHVTLKKFLNYMKGAFSVFSVQKHTGSDYEKENVAEKVYPVDNGLIGKKDSKGRLLEAAIFQELKRSNYEVEYLKTTEWELDFVVNKEIAVQVCYQLEKENYDREIRPLKNKKMFKKQILVCMYGYEAFEFPENVRVISAEAFITELDKYLKV